MEKAKLGEEVLGTAKATPGEAVKCHGEAEHRDAMAGRSRKEHR